MHYKRKKVNYEKLRLCPSLVISCKLMHETSNTSVYGSKNVSGVHCVAPGCTNYF